MRGDDMAMSFEGVLRIIMGAFDMEGAKRNVEFLVNSLGAMGIDRVWLKIPPGEIEVVDVAGPLRFKLFGALAAGKPADISIVASEEVVEFLQEELGSGLQGAILTLETATSRRALI